MPDARDRDAPKTTIAYTMSRFPLLSETFVLLEIVELERLGFRVEIFPLLRVRHGVVHAEAGRLRERVHHLPALSMRSAAAQLYWLLARPRAYLTAWWRALRGNARSWRFLVRALVVVPQAAAFARAMRTLGVEHIHAHYATHPALAAYTVHLLTGIPYSITAHAHDIYVDRTMLGEKLNDAAFVVAISDYNRALLARSYGPQAERKTVVVRCGVDPEAFRPRAATEPGPFTVICVASLQDYKGHPHLIDACALLERSGMSFRCLLVGDGEDRARLAQQVERLGLGDRVVFCGPQPRSEVRRLLAEADVFVLPSIVTATGKMEGLPVALMEALAGEMPVVATAISGIPELVRDGETGLLVPQRDPAALADAIRRLHDDPQLAARLGRAGRQLVLERHDIRRNVAVLADLITGVRRP